MALGHSRSPTDSTFQYNSSNFAKILIICEVGERDQSAHGISRAASTRGRPARSCSTAMSVHPDWSIARTASKEL
jgi:hypothetical protein